MPPPIVTIIHLTETPVSIPATETPTIVPTPTALPHLMYPYTIAGLRERTFSGGEMQILQTLLQTQTYTRYLISYPSDGLTITGVLQIPAGEGPFPVIVMNHGFSKRSEYISGDGTDRAAAYLVERGYVTIASDFRTWGDSDFSPSFFHTGLVVDVMNLMASLPSLPQADISRIGMWGHSMGGGITTKILTLESPVRAAVLYAPNSADDADLIARWGYGCLGDISAGEMVETCNSADVIPDTLPDEVTAAYIESTLSEERMREIAPFYHLEYVSVPVQIHIGSADGDYIGSTPPEWSYKLNQGLIDAGKDVDLFVYDGQRHSFTGDAWTQFMDRAIGFFKEYLN
ncbi:MAG: alpha/beta fold hydrolase [Anaerolineales bacterium]|uniref:alpha/beta hydrolase family protein n=1 Tax=Candidatus Villigracilis proximus TaxID=3140683 RepID=UPI0031354823|nr:alpha/beta fold hydrolase [Anaerolineales bacterium]